jgi:hypothetical protein
MDMMLLAQALTHAEKGGTTLLQILVRQETGSPHFSFVCDFTFKRLPSFFADLQEVRSSAFGQLFMYRVASPPNSTSSSLVAPEGLVRASWVSVRSQIHTKNPISSK